MKFIKKICLFFNAIRWYMRDKEVSGNVVNNFGVEIYKAFAEEHKAEYDDFSSKLKLNEIKKVFDFFNSSFRRNEVFAIITGINEHEKLYRHRNSISWISHGDLSFKPYFISEYPSKYIPMKVCLTLYFYIIASYMDVDFYPSSNGFTDDDEFKAEGIRSKPYYLELIGDKYSVTEDFKVNII